MSFRVPNFNLTVDIYRFVGAGGVYGTPDVSVKGNLTPGRRSFLGAPTTPATTNNSMCMELLLPAGTDIRANWNGIAGDAVEVPKSSKRFYTVLHVDDTAKGFPNEYRLALLLYEPNGNAGLLGANSAPVPLP